ncbi:hypothetical protein DO021_18875 [Desulfobacter hydrogenophilus]|uniref:VWFA domain-containing protein n=1 Tax=Desulfobacter hydrogenophilus TaxID=2291 RepID=A0A328F7U0_9BACT|nr:hypothetical protein [Desulfobacter hydrogenophilus]NDY73832.1 hypothetical protein [Desulfobacter hydrogenophilus]QBH13157.1 hypothetical protein EYB58_09640 [Desulfobacter hydrogenophilus]RAM00449.1 hypothetical protein DO021_18875 [Desulfobacter hydrogenophilus]
MLNKQALFTALIVLLVVSGVSRQCFAEDDDRVGRHLIMIVDYSGSVGENLPKYWEAVTLVTGCRSPGIKVKKKDLCKKITGDEQITIFKITGQSSRKPDIIADMYFRKKGTWESKLKYDKEVRKSKLAFKEQIARAFSGAAKANNTEIIAAIRLSKLYFDDVNAKQKKLIILSDMIEESEFFNFQKKKVLPGKIIETEKKGSRLPDLNGINVYVSGAYAGTQKKYDEVKNFWETYFNEAGAVLKCYRPQMITFD